MILSTIQRNIDNTIGFMSDFWTIAAASEQSGYPASNLLTPDLNQKWVSWGQRASHNWIQAASNAINDYRQIHLVGLLGLDRSSPNHTTSGVFSTNSYRIIVDRYPVSTRRRPPVATVALTNLTGTAATLNGPVDPPNLTPVGYASTKMTTSNNAANTVLVADFENYNATERPLSPVNQWIRLHYVHSTLPNEAPVLEVKLRYNGVLTALTLTLRATEKTSEGYMLSYRFNPADLPGLTGRVGVQVTGTTTGASTPLPIGVEWVTELEGWGTDGESWDSLIDTTVSGEIVYPQIVEMPEKLASDPELGVIPFEILENEVVYVFIELSDWVETFPLAELSPYVPLGGHEGVAFYAGRLAITEGLSVGLKETGGFITRKASDISALRTYGGTLRGTRNALHWNEYDFNCRIQPQDLIVGDLDRFFENAGMRNPVVIVPDERDPGQAIYGVLTRWEAPDVGAWIDNGEADQYYDLSFSAVDARGRRTLR